VLSTAGTAASSFGAVAQLVRIKAVTAMMMKFFIGFCFLFVYFY
jgi:hypothetical protein